MANFIMGIIGLSVGVVVLSGVFINSIKTANQTGTCFYANGSGYSCGWTSADIAMWGLLSIVGIAGLVYGVLNVFGLG